MSGRVKNSSKNASHTVALPVANDVPFSDDEGGAARGPIVDATPATHPIAALRRHQVVQVAVEDHLQGAAVRHRELEVVH